MMGLPPKNKMHVLGDALYYCLPRFMSHNSTRSMFLELTCTFNFVAIFQNIGLHELLFTHSTKTK